jgi:hypothetical protein
MSLIHGWIPVTVQLIAAVVVLLAIGRRSRRWLLLWVPLALLIGVGLAGAVYWYVTDQGVADEPAPLTLWAWVTVSGLAAAAVVLGWPGAAWWQRAMSVLAVPLCVLSATLALNHLGWLRPHRECGLGPRDRVATARAV